VKAVKGMPDVLKNLIALQTIYIQELYPKLDNQLKRYLVGLLKNQTYKKLAK
jgi:hypothetical protein